MYDDFLYKYTRNSIVGRCGRSAGISRLGPTMTESAGGTGTGKSPAKLSLSTGGSGSSGREGRLVISGVKAGDGTGPRVFLLSAVKAERPAAAEGGSATSTSRVSLLRTGAQTPGGCFSPKPADTLTQGKTQLLRVVEAPASVV